MSDPQQHKATHSTCNSINIDITNFIDDLYNRKDFTEETQPQTQTLPNRQNQEPCLRNDGWENFLNRVISFRKNHEIEVRDMRNDAKFQQVKDLGGLSCMLVETNKHRTFPYVYLLLKLVLILPVATTSVESVFSGMSFVKSSLVTFIKKDIFLQVSDENVLCLVFRI
uniref:HAT C-terminal dimerisation domain-containing protein n=1 Tax=Kalanchoe fedtschenkoi TaxID=63787 RepID=A0A7N0UYI5_KALFE